MFLQGKIDKLGFFHLERKGMFRAQYCPVQDGKKIGIGCGEWCPLFGEPEVMDGYYKITLCAHEPLFIKELIDERTLAESSTGEGQ
jgi:hypothetical protein